MMRLLRVSCGERVDKNSIRIPPICLQHIILAEKSNPSIVWVSASSEKH